MVYVHFHKNLRTKLDPCALQCLFIGYATHPKGYRCYDSSSKCTCVTIDLTFSESNIFFSPMPNFFHQGETKNEELNFVLPNNIETKTTPNPENDRTIEVETNVEAESTKAFESTELEPFFSIHKPIS